MATLQNVFAILQYKDHQNLVKLVKPSHMYGGFMHGTIAYGIRMSGEYIRTARRQSGHRWAESLGHGAAVSALSCRNSIIALIDGALFRFDDTDETPARVALAHPGEYADAIAPRRDEQSPRRFVSLTCAGTVPRAFDGTDYYEETKRGILARVTPKPLKYAPDAIFIGKGAWPIVATSRAIYVYRGGGWFEDTDEGEFDYVCDWYSLGGL